MALAREPNRSKLNGVGDGRELESVVLVAPSNRIEVSFRELDGVSTVVGRARSGWRRRVERAQRVCILQVKLDDLAHLVMKTTK